MKASRIRMLPEAPDAHDIAWAIVAGARAIGDYARLKADPKRALAGGLRARWIALAALRIVWGERACEGLARSWHQGRYTTASMLKTQRRQSWWSEDAVREIAFSLSDAHLNAATGRTR